MLTAEGWLACRYVIVKQIVRISFPYIGLDETAGGVGNLVHCLKIENER